jgi:hypothetical protein
MALFMLVVSTPAFAQMPKPDWRSQSRRESRGLVESLREAGNFTKLLVILDKAGLTDTLASPAKTVTLFAPDDDAFALLPAVLLAELTADPAKARQFILPYIVAGKFTGKDLIPPVPRHRLRTLSGSSLQISKMSDANASPQWGGLLVIFDPAQMGVGGSPTGWPCCGRIVSADHLAANGIYHEITFASANGGVWK